MSKTIKCVNNNGMSATFMYDHDNTEFFLVSLDGVYSIKNAVNTSQNATTDGSSYSGEALEQRNIVITANIRRNYRQNRDTLSRVFKVHSQGTFYHIEDGETRKIEYYVESIDVEEKGILRACTISLICPDPYFKDDTPTHIEMASWEDGFEFELEIDEEQGMEFGARSKETIKTVDNESTTAIGIQMTIIAEDTVVNYERDDRGNLEAALHNATRRRNHHHDETGKYKCGTTSGRRRIRLQLHSRRGKRRLCAA